MAAVENPPKDDVCDPCIKKPPDAAAEAEESLESARGEPLPAGYVEVHTTTTGGVVETCRLPRDAKVIDLRKAFRDVGGVNYKLVDETGRGLGAAEDIGNLIGASNVLNVTRINLVHPLEYEALLAVESSKDPNGQDLFDLKEQGGLFAVTTGEQTYGGQKYMTVQIMEPQAAFQTQEALSPYKAGYDYFELFEERDRGDGRLRYFLAREQEFVQEFRTRLPELSLMLFRVFENPNRIYKITAYFDRDGFAATRENLFRFLLIFFDLLADKSSTLN